MSQTSFREVWARRFPFTWALKLIAAVIFSGTSFFGWASPAVTSDGAQQDGNRNTISEARQFLNESFRPGGTGVAYVLGLDVTANRAVPAILFYKDLATGNTVTVNAGAGSVEVGSRITQSWSPDGSVLAYSYPESGSGRWYVHLWRPGGASDLKLSHACSPIAVYACPQPIWSPDGKTLYFFAQPDDLGQQEAVYRQSLNSGEQGHSKVDRGNSETGINVLESDENTKARGVSKGAYEHVHNMQVFAVDTRNGELRTIFTGETLSFMWLSPDGLTLLLKSELGSDGPERQNYSNWYLVPVTSAPRDKSHAPDDPKTGQVNPFLRKTKFWTAAWSPDSTKIAFNENGVLTQGNVFVYQVGTNSLTNLTPSLPPREKNEIELPASRSLWNATIPRGKFDSRSIVWTAASDGVYALRRTFIASDCRTRLWMIQLNGSLKNLTEGAAYDAEAPLPSYGGGRIVTIRQPDGQSGFAEFSEQSREIGTITQIDGEFYSELVRMVKADPRSGKVLFIASNDKAPQEAFVFDPQTHKSVQITSINKNVPSGSLPLVHTVRWSSTSGPHVGYLYAPRLSHGLPPLVVQVYPREKSSAAADAMDYPGRPGIFLPALADLLAKGYAIFKPDLPVAGGGNTCSDIAANIDAALLTIRSAGLADIDRAAIIGHSFGGWTVNCVVTKSDRFRAAVAVAGLSDLVSSSFSPNPKVQSWSAGGGQTDIDRTLWEAPDLYWRESPVSGAQNVITPLLLIHGTDDSTVPMSQSFEMYSALARFAKTVTVVTYDGADHDTVLSRPDFRPRVEAWIEKYLGKPQSNTDSLPGLK